MVEMVVILVARVDRVVMVVIQRMADTEAKVAKVVTVAWVVAMAVTAGIGALAAGCGRPAPA